MSRDALAVVVLLVLLAFLAGYTLAMILWG
jgi:hypothetical protein